MAKVDLATVKQTALPIDLETNTDNASRLVRNIVKNNILSDGKLNSSEAKQNFERTSLEKNDRIA